jgi:hypothetical protein
VEEEIQLLEEEKFKNAVKEIEQMNVGIKNIINNY